MKTYVTTLLLVIKDNKILLAEKLRGFGTQFLNGVGGKVMPGETVEEAMLRETKEEVGIVPTKYKCVAINEFDEYVKGERATLFMHIFIATEYKGVPTESEEMRPHWFSVNEIPYNKMFPDDAYWLPEVLKGNKVKGFFKLDENFNLIGHEVKVVKSL